MTDRSDGPPGFDFAFTPGDTADTALATARTRIAAAHRADETATVRSLVTEARLAPAALATTQAHATRLAEAVRAALAGRWR